MISSNQHTANISTDLTKQMLGLTQEHIYFTDKKVGIHREMITAYQALSDAALNDGIEISIASGFRSFERQLCIWNNKFSGKTPIKNSQGNIIEISTLSPLEVVQAILLYSALPGASRHHWGCDIDIYAKNLLPNDHTLQLEPWEYESQGPFATLSTWLATNAHLFGFYFPYDTYRGGVAAEPWHLSYAPLASQYQSAFNLANLRQCLASSDLLGKDIIIDNLPGISQQYIHNVQQFT